MSEAEEKAIVFASRAGGEYLDSIGVTDLERLAHAQWMEFLKIVCLRFAEKKAEIDSCPF